jgi:hypothetical protein
MARYCENCKKIYTDDSQDCECTKVSRYDWQGPVKMIDMEDTPLVCKDCGSTENLIYHEPYKWISINRVTPAFCRCKECEDKREAEIKRQESMKYYLMDNNSDEYKLMDSDRDIKKALEGYTEDCERESGTIDGVLVLKLEPFNISDLDPDDFKNPKKTSIVIIDDEAYKIEDVIEPETDIDADMRILL